MISFENDYVAIEMPNRKGNISNCVLSLGDYKEYEKNESKKVYLHIK